ncbi:hypothetical protein JG688_00014521 [Phytophthora aleatoria]|uniref:Uncharacterized protein n=1 Tax=Phytophthora aleatoria TaxID=2496075 RepID=A0A8J5IBS2_9STRA|nr:hypothetical protein JG688_00014521 [Phytophthora aleatoria]
MDGASYHKTITNKNPTMNSNRAEMHTWLSERGTKNDFGFGCCTNNTYYQSFPCRCKF